MSRVDTPTLMCDRCSVQTQDLFEMSQFYKVTHIHQSGNHSWDLCPDCWGEFTEFMAD